MFIFIVSIRVSSFLVLINMKDTPANNAEKLNKISESLNGSIPDSFILVGLFAVGFGISWYIGTRIVSYYTSDSNPNSCPTDADFGSGSDFTDSGWDSDYSDTNSSVSSVSSDISPDVSNQANSLYNSLYSVFNSVHESFSDSLCSISAGISSGISSGIKLGIKFGSKLGLMCLQNGIILGPIFLGITVFSLTFIAFSLTHHYLIVFYDPQVVIVEQTWKEYNEKGLYSGLCLWCDLEYSFIKACVVRVCEILAYLKMKLAYHFGRLSKFIFGLFG